MAAPNATVTTVGGYPVFTSQDSNGVFGTPQFIKLWSGTSFVDWAISSEGNPIVHPVNLTTYSSQDGAVAWAQGTALRLQFQTATNLTSGNSESSLSVSNTLQLASGLLLPKLATVSLFVANTTNEVLNGISFTFSETVLGQTATTSAYTASSVSVPITNGTGVYTVAISGAFGSTMTLTTSWAAAPTSGSAAVIAILS